MTTDCNDLCLTDFDTEAVTVGDLTLADTYQNNVVINIDNTNIGSMAAIDRNYIHMDTTMASSYAPDHLTMPGFNTINTSMNTTHILGDAVKHTEQHKVYIVEPWQSRKPIHIEGDLHVSLEEDLLSRGELKEKILNKLMETHPEVIIEIGFEPHNIKLVKNEVTIEIKEDR